MQDYHSALTDVNIALSIDPKSSAAYKCRFKIYQQLAQVAVDRDELDGNGASDSEEDVSKASTRRLLLMCAHDALAGELHTHTPPPA